LKKLTYSVLALALFVVFTIVFSPLSNSMSSNPCGACGHGGYYQYLNVLVGDSNTQIPTMLNVSETKIVAVTIQNDVGTYLRYTSLSSVSVTLSSARGHFSVSVPTVFVGDLAPGTTTVSWQITGVSDGYDFIIILASGYNTHRGITFQDHYNSPYVPVGQPTEPIPTPPPTPTPAPTVPPIPMPTPTQTAPTKPTPTNTPQPTSGTNQTQQLTIQLLSPSPNEQWLPQTNHTIEWKASGGTAPLNVTLEYTSASRNDTWTTIANNLPNEGIFDWTTPNAASDYFIRASVKDSASSPQTTSTTAQVAVEAQNPESPVVPILAAVIATIIILIALVLVRRMRAGRAKK
jgi:hypothetical protein